MHRIEPTGDLSPTLYSEEFDQTYHSRHGALSESLHVFIHHGLLEVAKHIQDISIFEMGYGTGLNAALTWQYALKKNFNVKYIALEKFPVESQVFKQLASQDEHLNTLWNELNETLWNEEQTLHGLRIQKIQGDLTQFSTSKKFDLIYYDAFSPNSQPELWTADIFKMLFETMHTHGVLVTYCAKGEVKRNLRQAGFSIESLPGPIGKREMTRARKNPTVIS